MYLKLVCWHNVGQYNISVKVTTSGITTEDVLPPLEVLEVALTHVTCDIRWILTFPSTRQPYASMSWTERNLRFISVSCYIGS